MNFSSNGPLLITLHAIDYYGIFFFHVVTQRNVQINNGFFIIINVNIEYSRSRANGVHYWKRVLKKTNVFLGCINFA